MLFRFLLYTLVLIGIVYFLFCDNTVEEVNCNWRDETGAVCVPPCQVLVTNTSQDSIGGGGGADVDPLDQRLVTNHLNREIQIRLLLTSGEQTDLIVLQPGESYYQASNTKIQNLMIKTFPADERLFLLNARKFGYSPCYQTLRAPFQYPNYLVSQYELSNLDEGFDVHVRAIDTCKSDQGNPQNVVTIKNELVRPVSVVVYCGATPSSEYAIQWDISPYESRVIDCNENEIIQNIQVQTSQFFMIVMPWPSCFDSTLLQSSYCNNPNYMYQNIELPSVQTIQGRPEYIWQSDKQTTQWGHPEYITILSL